MYLEKKKKLPSHSNEKLEKDEWFFWTGSLSKSESPKLTVSLPTKKKNKTKQPKLLHSVVYLWNVA